MTFSFLGESRRVDRWDLAAPRLWAYNLHYFDDLNASKAFDRRAWHVEAIRSWIEGNPPVAVPAWEPYPTSLRIVNWIKWALGGGPLDRSMIESLALQARALDARLEYHLLGNHLLANGKALVFAGVFFEGGEAESWLAKGVRVLERELDEQVLADGGHFERSPMYHALVLEDVADLVNLASAFPDAIARAKPVAAHWAQVVNRMRPWLRAMTHPDGEVAFFNDSAVGIAPSPADLERYAAAVTGGSSPGPQATGEPVRVLQLPDSGYIRAETSDAVMLLDVAPIGPDYLPGHAHADTLSFELSLGGQRLIVNGGTSVYEPGTIRLAERGTAAHSTVVIDGEDSSEVWASFRVARRARPIDLSVEPGDDRLRVVCSHDGYGRLRGRPIHRRTWTLAPGTLRIEDRIVGTCRSAVAYYHLHPKVQVSMDADGRAGVLGLPGGQAARWKALSGTATIEESSYAPEFGARIPSRRLVLDFAGADTASFEIAW